MSHALRTRGLVIGRMPPGPTNSLTDVPGILVGHATLIEGNSVRTGVTAIRPHAGDLVEQKLKAASIVLNGYGKPIGLSQVDELGVIETPILLTSTMAVGKVADALVSWVLQRREDTSPPITSLNPLVAECNDSYLNDIQARPVRTDHVFAALESAHEGAVDEGAIGAGTGLSAFEWKSGIGSASRRIPLGGETFTVGALSLSNFGHREELRIDGHPIGGWLRNVDRDPDAPSPGGSIVVVLGTDLPLSHRQLARVARRAGIGIARTGGTCHQTSGEFVIAFTTADPVPADASRILLEERRLNDAHRAIDPVFQAVIEAVEESILCALFEAKTMTGFNGHRRAALPVEQVLALLRAPGPASA